MNGASWTGEALLMHEPEPTGGVPMRHVFAAVLAAVFFLTGCEDPAGLDPLTVAPGPPPTAPIPQPGPSSPGEAGGGTSAPTYTTVFTNTGDSLTVPAAVTVGVGDTVSLPARMVLGPGNSYGVLVGMERSWCQLGVARIVGVTIPEPPEGRFGLTPADYFTDWTADACFHVGFRVLTPGIGKVYEFTVQVVGVTPGRAQVRVFMELLGFSGDQFRYPFVPEVEVVP